MLSILYLRCLRPAVTRGLSKILTAFNSLFEMLLWRSPRFTAHLRELSILYLRCIDKIERDMADIERDIFQFSI